eukprot:37200-Pyramimonas_sp.AAC.1
MEATPITHAVVSRRCHACHELGIRHVLSMACMVYVCGACAVVCGGGPQCGCVCVTRVWCTWCAERARNALAFYGVCLRGCKSVIV